MKDNDTCVFPFSLSTYVLLFFESSCLLLVIFMIVFEPDHSNQMGTITRRYTTTSGKHFFPVLPLSFSYKKIFTNDCHSTYHSMLTIHRLINIIVIELWIRFRRRRRRRLMIEWMLQCSIVHNTRTLTYT